MIETIFFDRDGIINEVVWRGETVSSPRQFTEFKLRQEFIDFYEAIDNLNLNMFVVSNQPDVARSLLAEKELAMMNELMLKRFRFKEIVYCRHDDAVGCACRKPKPGMLEQLIAKYKIDRHTAIMIGDSWKDIAAGKAAQLRTVYLRQSYNVSMQCQPDIVIENLLDVKTIDCFASLSK